MIKDYVGGSTMLKRTFTHTLPLVTLLTTASSLLAQHPPSYAKQVKPFLAKYCLECHNNDSAKGGLVAEAVKGLAEGGNNGPAFVPGKPDESRLVLQVEGKLKPTMPPRTARQPKPEERAVLRAWIAAGAKDDSTEIAVSIPHIKPTVPSQPPVSALAYRPDGRLLAAGSYKEVVLIDPASGDVIGKLAGQTAKVTGLVFRRDGQRLAVASGAVGVGGEVRIYEVPANGIPASLPVHVIAAHKDLIHDLVFSPDGKHLATCSYDRLIKLWDVDTGKELRTLKDHSDAVYGLAFSPDGKLLASAAADRAVKVWELATSKRLYTLGEATDWLYAVAWSPDGKFLSAAGVDKSIRVWEVSATEGKLVHSVFAHEGPITRLVYAADGKTLYSLSEDRTVKMWEKARMTEQKVYAQQPELVLALAIRPDHKQLALGRYDGTALLLDDLTGKVQAEPLPIKPKPPLLSKLTPNFGRRGQTIRVSFEGKYLDDVTEITASHPGFSTKLVAETKAANVVHAEVLLPANTPAGNYRLGLKTSAGEAQLPFIVDLYEHVTEREPNDAPRSGQQVTLPISIVGKADRAGDVDFYRFEAQGGQQIGVQVLASAVGSKLDPSLLLLDAAGQVAAESTSGVLGYTCPKPGIYTLGIHDRDYRGGADMHYRLHAGDIPVVTALFPLGLQRGTEADVQLAGVHLGETHSVRVSAPADAALGAKLPVPISTTLGTPLDNLSVAVGEFPEKTVAPPWPVTPVLTQDRVGLTLPHGTAVARQVLSLPVPGTGNGRIFEPGHTDTWRFTAHKGQRLIVEVNARRLGSPLDSTIEILDAKGQLVPRATLRCQAKTYTVFRDHDSASPGIRIEAWNELAINDYLYVGNELLRIDALPKNPDDDCRFFSVAGQRLGYLDTTPTFHSLGEPMYKVAIHPPGTPFPPNGFPIITVPFRNDDGGPGYGKDSRLFFDPPTDDEYQVRIGDARGQGGNAYAYRLTIRPPRPDFKVSFNPSSPAVWKGGALPITVSCERLDGYDGAIAARLDNLPPGFSAPPTTIPAEENSTAFALFAEPAATVPDKVPALKLVARATIDGKEVVREVTGGLPKAVEPGDIVTTTEQPEVIVRAGGQVRLTATIERRNGFKGRVPVEVRGLPHGVRVLDIGLNGILITERETSRSFVIYCEPWVQPMEHPIVVLAKREGKNTEHAAKSVLLKIEK